MTEIEIVAFLQGQGYTVEPHGTGYRARHEQFLDFSLRGVEGGVLFGSFFSPTEAARAERAELLELINRMNGRVIVSRFYLDPDGDLIQEAWLSATLGEEAVARYVEAWQRDGLSIGAEPDLRRFVQ